MRREASQAPVGGASSRGVVCAALRRTCASPAAGGRSGTSEFPRGAASADRRWLPSPPSGRRSPASRAERLLCRLARAFRLRVSAWPGSTAPGLRRSTRPGGWLAAVAARAVPVFPPPAPHFSLSGFQIPNSRSVLPDPGSSP